MPAVARLLAFAIVLVGVVLALVWMGQRRMIYFPSGDVPAPAQVGLPRAEAVSFATDDGLMLHGWFVPAGRPDAETVIVFNGNAGNRAYRSDLAVRFAAEGMAVLLFDYRGYGGNPGSPSEEGLALDARAARRYVLSRPDVDARRLVYFGESLGSAMAVPAVDGASRPCRHVCALPSRRSWTWGGPTTLSCQSDCFSWTGIRRSIASRGSGARCSSSPARTTPSFPSSQSRRLFEAALEPKRLLIIEGADHNDEALNAGPQLITAVTEFVRGLNPKP